MRNSSKSLNLKNINKSVSDIRIRIRFTFESSFWISVPGCKLTILPDIQPANRIVIISDLYHGVVSQCCQPYGFPAKLGLFFLWICGFFEGLRVACCWASCKWNFLVFWACFFRRFLFCGLLFLNFVALLLFHFTAKGILGVFLWKFAHFGLVFSDLHLCFFI